MIEIVIKPELKAPRLTLASDGRVTLKARDAEEASRFTKLVEHAIAKFGIPARTLRGKMEQLGSTVQSCHLSTAQSGSREYTSIALEA